MLFQQMIKTPVAHDIRQLIMSPNEDYLAVLTSHTIHICVLPDSSHLTAKDTTPFKPKFWTLGPTTHVTSKAALASALWHPLGVGGSALVTITEDAVVRVWELSMSDRWSFDSPTLAIDLKKLADGTSLDQDFSASTSTTNAGFSPDSFDMEVASASFGDRLSGGWSPMTLWIAMRGGDVYALCPLLPQKWAPPPTLVPSLSVSIVAKVAATEDDNSISAEARLLAQQQLDWMADLDNQDARIVEGPVGEPPLEVYSRPSRPGMVPKLQGPFNLDLAPEDEQDDDVELTDIYVIGEKISTADLMNGEEDDLEIDQEGLSMSVICLLSTSGRVKVCLDLDGVEAQWLPPRRASKFRPSAVGYDIPSLLIFQTLDTLKPAENTPDNWPSFSEDITSRYSFFVSQSCGITYISLAPWVFRLEGELQSASEAGSKFRIDVLVKGNGSIRERVYTQRPDLGTLAACVAIRDPDLGYFILSATNQDPVALFFETPEEESTATLRQPSPSPIPKQEEERRPLTLWEPRPLFHASDVLEKESPLPRYLEHLKTGKRRPLMHQEVRLSLATLEIFTESHRLVSAGIEPLNVAVAELFRKCEALQVELREQVSKSCEVRNRVDAISGDDVDQGEPMSDNMVIQARIRSARERQEALARRMDALKRKLGDATSRELSDKELAWIEEVRSLDGQILGRGSADQAAIDSKAKQPLARFREVNSLKGDLLSRIERLQRESSDGPQPNEDHSASPNYKIPSDIKRTKFAQVRQLLDRETALVDALKSRLQRLAV
jgi:nucleoporin NUP82